MMVIFCALPEVDSQESVNDLEVEIRYYGEEDWVSELYIDSVWLELFTLQPDQDSDLLSYQEFLLDDGYSTEILSGDRLELPDGKIITFDFTDENNDETLIIKSSEQSYPGLTKTKTYFSVTNESTRTDEFSLQTYFSDEDSSVRSLREFTLNKPSEVSVPEYRPCL